jgi:DNA-binding GntR family transcriptional regulator
MQSHGKSSRVNDAYVQIKAEILSNRLPPGFQAPEPEVALRLGMSRTPVREALIRLEADGLVELIPRRGVRVLPLRAEDMREIYEVLIALEAEAAAAFAETQPEEARLVRLIEATDEMDRALAQGDRDAWAEADNRFHQEVLALHGNRRLIGVAKALSDQAHRARVTTLKLRDLTQTSSDEHRQIIRALKNGDPATARKAFRAHRDRAVHEILSILEKLQQL